MYNLSLPNLSATLLLDVYRSSPNYQLTLCTLYCAVPFIATCVDITRTVFRDRLVLHLLGEALILVAKLLISSNGYTS